MPIVTTQPSITATAALVASGLQASVSNLKSVMLRNDSGSDIFIGGAGVTTANGYKLPTATQIAIDLGPNDDLWAVCTTGPLALQVLRLGA